MYIKSITGGWFNERFIFNTDNSRHCRSGNCKKAVYRKNGRKRSISFFCAYVPCRYVVFCCMRKRSAVGYTGEMLVLEYETELLRKCGSKLRPDHIALTDPSAGYDIISYDEKGNTKYIEVKTRKAKNTTKLDFFITANEREKFEKTTLQEIIKYLNSGDCYTKEELEIGKELIKVLKIKLNDKKIEKEEAKQKRIERNLEKSRKRVNV